MTNENPYAPPSSSVVNDSAGDLDGVIDALEVFDRWKEKFRAIALAGGPSLPNRKQLPKDMRRQALGFNVLAFLFGPLYYLAKGMWKKAILYFVALMVLLILLDIVLNYFGQGEFGRALGYGAAAFFSVKANGDYYKKMVLKDNGWY
jgi:hypothetical protein